MTLEEKTRSHSDSTTHMRPLSSFQSRSLTGLFPYIFKRNRFVQVSKSFFHLLIKEYFGYLFHELIVCM